MRVASKIVETQLNTIGSNAEISVNTCIGMYSMVDNDSMVNNCIYPLTSVSIFMNMKN